MALLEHLYTDNQPTKPHRGGLGRHDLAIDKRPDQNHQPILTRKVPLQKNTRERISIKTNWADKKVNAATLNDSVATLLKQEPLVYAFQPLTVPPLPVKKQVNERKRIASREECAIPPVKASGFGKVYTYNQTIHRFIVLMTGFLTIVPVLLVGIFITIFHRLPIALAVLEEFSVTEEEAAVSKNAAVDGHTSILTQNSIVKRWKLKNRTESVFKMHLRVPFAGWT
jgi:hypothetical protein